MKKKTRKIIGLIIITSPITGILTLLAIEDWMALLGFFGLVGFVVLTTIIGLKFLN